MPPAPGRFSTTKACPMDFENWSAITRARMSVAEPAVKGTMTFTGPDGYDCAKTTALAARTSAENANDRTGRMDSSLRPILFLRLQPAEEQQDQQDEEQQAQATAGGITPTATVRPRRHRTQQQQHRDDQQDHTDRHSRSPVRTIPV